MWAIPYGTVVQTLAYRRTSSARQASIPIGPQNWDEVFEYAAKMTNPEEGEYGIGTRPARRPPGTSSTSSGPLAVKPWWRRMANGARV